MSFRNSLKLALLLVVACSTCGCDLKALKSLYRQGGNNSVDIYDNTVIINIINGNADPLPDDEDNGTNQFGSVGQGTYQIPPTQSFLPGDLNFRGPNYTSFLPPTAPSAVGNPF